MGFLRSRTTYIAIGVIALNLALFAFGFYASFLRGLPNFASFEDYRPPLTSVVFDRNGKPIGEFFYERRRLVSYEQIPRQVVLAFIAGEDAKFFEHEGIDYVSVLRAAWVNLRAGGTVRQGGSTITQQVAKSLLSSERSIRRKVKDMLLARRIEKHLSKEEILYLYLNQIYLGSGSYGVAEATRRYFGKELSEITLSEAATLAGLPKAPSNYSPIRHPERADMRRRYVLKQMLGDGFIDRATYEQALAEPITLARPPEYKDYEIARYFTEEVRRDLVERLGEEQLLRGGLRIETSADVDLQRKAVEAVKKGLEDLDHRLGYRGPLRQIPAEDIDGTLEALATENDLLPPEPEETVAQADGETHNETAAAPKFETSPEPVPLELPEGKSLVGVVTKVDEAAQRAIVGFAPGLFHELTLETVKWAREPNPKKSFSPVNSISKIVRVGDVARFILRPPAEIPETPDGLVSATPVLDFDQVPEAQGGLISFEVESGDVLALVGGYDYNANQFNRATQAHRQPGSAIKPLIYAAALAKGYTPASIIQDTAVVYTNADGSIWKPKNYTPYFHGPVTLRQSLIHSYNTATIRLFRDVGTEYVIDYMQHLGIISPLDHDLSLALGSSPVTLLELSRAYAVFPAEGRRVIPRFIKRITDRDGVVLLENIPLGDLGEPVLPTAQSAVEDSRLPLPEPVVPAANTPPEVPSPEDPTQGTLATESEPALDPNQLIPPTEAYLATDLVRAVVVDPHGTGWRARKLHRALGAKTGTTNQQADAWFVGFSPDLVTGVWVGFDRERVLGRGETGSRAASPIWVDFMETALKSRPDRDFPVPPGISFARVDRDTGRLADSASENSYFQAFIEGTEPTETEQPSVPLRPDAF